MSQPPSRDPYRKQDPGQYQGQPHYSPPPYDQGLYPQGKPPDSQQPNPPPGHHRHSSQQAPRDPETMHTGGNMHVNTGQPQTADDIGERLFREARQTRIAVQVIAWVVCIFAVLTIIGIIVDAVVIHSVLANIYNYQQNSTGGLP